MRRKRASQLLLSLGITAVIGTFWTGCIDGTRDFVLRRLPNPDQDGSVTGAGGASGGIRSISDASTERDVAGGGDSGIPDITVGSGGSDADGGSTGTGIFDSACSPTLDFQNLDAEGKGMLFDQVVSDPQALVTRSARTVCSILYRSADEVPEIPEVTLIVEDIEAPASVAAAVIRLSSGHLQNVSDQGGDVLREITGVLHHTLSYVYQFDDGGSGSVPGWLISGTADFVRYQAGYLDAERVPGGSYQDGFWTTAFFLVWVNAEHPDFVYRLNGSMDPNDAVVWSEQVFVDLTGKDVESLWNDYQASF